METVALPLVAAFLGLVLGSFFNVVIHRLPKQESVVLPRSHCPRCLTPIRWYDNLPLLSYLFLGGRCRSCKAPISLRYPLVEALGALLLPYVVLRFGIGWETLRIFLFASTFLILFFTDLESRILPDELTLGGVLLAFGCSFFLDDPNWKGSLFGATLGFLILWGAYLFHLKWKKKEGLGWGDIKLILLIGALFGPFRMLWILITASLIGLIVGLGVIVLFKRGRDYELPFGSFLALASILFLFRFSWLEHFFSKWTNLAP